MRSLTQKPWSKICRCTFYAGFLQAMAQAHDSSSGGSSSSGRSDRSGPKPGSPPSDLRPRESSPFDDFTEISEESILHGRMMETKSRFHPLSHSSLTVDAQDFCTSVMVGIEELHALVETDFLTFRFLMTSLEFLRCMDTDVRQLVSKLRQWKHPESDHATAVYQNIVSPIKGAFTILRASVIAHRALLTFNVDKVISALDKLARLDEASCATTIQHVCAAEQAIQEIDVHELEVSRIHRHIKDLIDSKEGPYVGLYSFTSGMSSEAARAYVCQLSNVGRFLYTFSAASAYVCLHLLTAFGHMSHGPTLAFEPSLARLNCGWSSSMVLMHRDAEAVFKRMRAWNPAGSFLSPEQTLIESMLRDMTMHLRSLVRHGNVLSFGSYVNNWITDKKKLKKNLVLLKQQRDVVTLGLQKLSTKLTGFDFGCPLN